MLCPLTLAQPNGQTQGDSALQPPRELRGKMVLRISGDLLERLLARDIDKQTSVDRCVLGTRSRGSARTTGRADVTPKPDEDNAAFRVSISGQTQARTIGRNGPAIIHTKSKTTWTVTKAVRFDGGKFVASPGAIEASTKITPLSIASTKPGLRDLLIRKVARKRMCENLSCAEKITGRSTKQRVLEQVDSSVDDRIDKLNHRIQARPILDYFLSVLDSPVVEMSTSRNCIHVAFMGIDKLATVCPLDRLEPTETELWVHVSLLGLPDLDLLNLPTLQGEWMPDIFPNIDLAELDLPAIDLPELEVLGPLKAEWVDDWIVLRSGAEKSTSPSAK